MGQTDCGVSGGGVVVRGQRVYFAMLKLDVTCSFPRYRPLSRGTFNIKPKDLLSSVLSWLRFFSPSSFFSPFVRHFFLFSLVLRPQGKGNCRCGRDLLSSGFWRGITTQRVRGLMWRIKGRQQHMLGRPAYVPQRPQQSLLGRNKWVSAAGIGCILSKLRKTSDLHF